MLNPSIRAVCFDAVGTLLHPHRPVARVYAEVGRRYGSRRSEGEIVARFRTAFAREEEHDFGRDLRTDEPRELARWRSIVAEVLDDVDDPEACFASLFAHFGRPDAWVCTADTGTTLAALAGRGFRLAIGSNFDGRLRAVVAGRPELRAITHLGISSEMGWRKPAREFFAGLCLVLDLPPEAILFVGDDRGNDVEGARAAGLPAVLYDPGGRTTGCADLPRITSLAALMEEPS